MEAIEHFQNASKFFQLENSRSDSRYRQNYPSIDESARNSKTTIEFNKLFGLFGRNKFTVTVWQYLTKCFHKIKRYGAALKCLYKTLSCLTEALGNGEESSLNQE